MATHNMINQLRRKRGFTLAELMISVGIVSALMLCTMSLFIDSSRSSSRNNEQSFADDDVALAQAQVSRLLMEARRLTIDTDGRGVTYHYPATNTDGSYTLSAKTVDATARRIYVSSGTLYASSLGTKPILKSIPTTDPDTGSALRVFSVGINGKELLVKLVTTRTTAARTCANASKVIRIRLRNM